MGLAQALGHLFALGLRSEAGECKLLMLCAMSLLIELVQVMGGHDW